MTDAPDREISVHRSHKAPESVRNLLERLGFKGPENPLGDFEPKNSATDSEDE